MYVCVRAHAHLCLTSPEVDIQCVSQSLTIFLRSSVLVMEHTKFVDLLVVVRFSAGCLGLLFQ